MIYQFHDFRIMNSLSDIMIEMNKLHKDSYKSNGLVTTILMTIAIVALYPGGYLAEQGSKPKNDEEPVFKIGNTNVFKPEFFIPGMFLATLGGLSMLAYMFLKCCRPHYSEYSVHEKCERVVKEYNDKSE